MEEYIEINCANCNRILSSTLQDYYGTKMYKRITCPCAHPSQIRKSDIWFNLYKYKPDLWIRITLNDRSVSHYIDVYDQGFINKSYSINNISNFKIENIINTFIL